MEVGLQLDTSFLKLCLYMGVTIADFSKLGTMPVLKEELKITARGSATRCSNGPTKVGLISSWPELLVTFIKWPISIPSSKHSCLHTYMQTDIHTYNHTCRQTHIHTSNRTYKYSAHHR